MFVTSAYFMTVPFCSHGKRERLFYTEDCCFKFIGELIYVSGYIFVFVCHDAITLFGCFS